MSTRLARKVVSLLATLVLISAGTFALMRLVPGDPVDVMYGTEPVDPGIRAVMRAQLGLDRPVWVQYAAWVWRLVHGDLGYSYSAHMSVVQLIGQRLPATSLLAGSALVLAVLAAVPLGVASAAGRGTVIDLAGVGVAMASISLPSFVSGVLGVVVFAVTLRWLPVMGTPPAGAGPLQGLAYLCLPAATLAGSLVGVLIRLTRSTVLEELTKDYVRTARSKGLRERVVVARHVLKNALLPITTLVGLQLSFLLGGAVIVETIFAWPGIGSLVVNAILARDYPVVQAVVLLNATTVVLVSLLVDVLYGALDPRVRGA